MHYRVSPLSVTMLTNFYRVSLRILFCSPEDDGAFKNCPSEKQRYCDSSEMESNGDTHPELPLYVPPEGCQGLSGTTMAAFKPCLSLTLLHDLTSHPRDGKTLNSSEQGWQVSIM